MRIDDSVYGTYDVSSSLLTELINSDAMQRLKNVAQAGSSRLVRPGRSVSRFEHSLGVMRLTGLLGGSEAEQAAGLLQDVSHTAFSHTIDYVYDDRDESFHEQIVRKVVLSSDIPVILANHGLDWDTLFSRPNLIRVDVKAPLLCADRIDYTLRDLTTFGHIGKADASDFLANLTVEENKIVILTVPAATQFVEWYKFLVNELFMNPHELYVHSRFSQLLKRGLKEGVIVEDDLLKDDEWVLNRIRRTTSLCDELARILALRSECIDTLGHDARLVYSKGRIIDPPVLCGDQIRPLSEVAPESSMGWDRIVEISSKGLLVGSIC
jgi:HD superfamily phosphohydrolase